MQKEHLKKLAFIHDKTLSKLGMKGIKASAKKAYSKHHIIFCGEMLKVFPLKLRSRTRPRMAANIINIQHGRSLLPKQKEMKSIQTRKEKQKLPHLHMLCLPLWKVQKRAH